MGYDYKIETYDMCRAGLDDFLRAVDGFSEKIDSQYLYAITSCNVSSREDVVVSLDDNFVSITINCSQKAGAGILGQIIHHILAVNDHVVASGGH